MAGKSKIKQLPSAIRDQVNELIEAGATVDQIHGALTELGVSIGRSSVGRYVEHVNELGEKVRRSREVAEALVKRLGDAPENRTARLNIELLHTAIMDLFVAEAGGGQMDPENIMFLARSIQSLAGAQKSDADLILKLRREAEAAAALKAQEAIETVAKQRGMDAAAIAAMKRDFLGIRS